MPYITEEIWQHIYPLLHPHQPQAADAPLYLINQCYPTIDKHMINPAATHTIQWIQQFITGIRNIRGEMNIAPSKMLNILCYQGSSQEQTDLQKHMVFIKALAKLDSVQIINTNDNLPVCATALAGEMEIFIPMSDLIDKEAESKRLQKELEKLAIEIQRFEAKLDNPNYVQKAKAQVVLLERERLQDAQSKQNKLQVQLEKILAM